MIRRFAPLLIVVVGTLWLGAQASILFRTESLLATYDLPAHLHLAAVQMRHPNAMWDDAWYAGHPTYSYPPLAHRIAAVLMRRLGLEQGFKTAVAIAYVSGAWPLYAAARTLGALPPLPASLATLAAVISPALFRALLFGQYPSLVAFPVFWGTLAVLAGGVRAPRPETGLLALGALLVGILGSIHIFPLLMLPVVLAPLLMTHSAGHLIRRLGPPLALGAALAALPSVGLLADAALFAKTAIPHVTRTAAMIEPAGLLVWVLAPAGLPLILTLLFLLPRIGRRAPWWVGAAAALALLVYLREILPLSWLIVSIGYAICLTVAAPRDGDPDPRVTSYLVIAGMLSLWLALGPSGGLARLMPFADRLVFDRALLLGAPFASLALARALWAARPRGVRIAPALGAAFGATLLLWLSLVTVVEQYRSLVPGAQGAFPPSAAIPAPVVAFLRHEKGFGRVLPLGLPPVAYMLSDLTGKPLIDGLYNDARQLAPLRHSGVEAMGYEKFYDADLRLTRFFLGHAQAYGIRWVLTGDRFYDPVVPLDRFALVFETDEHPERSVRIYRAVRAPLPAWTGDAEEEATTVATLSAGRLGPFLIGGGITKVDRLGREAGLHLVLHGTLSHGWAISEVDLSALRTPCDQFAFRAWSPTGARLAVRVQRGGKWLLARPELPLPPRPAWVVLALPCGEVPRVQVALTGTGLHQTYLSDMQLRRLRNRATAVPVERQGPECFRIRLPDSAAATVSLVAFPRWRAHDPGVRLGAGSDARGLLRLQGSPGVHLVCLGFPEGFRMARNILPLVYVALSGIVLVVIAVMRTR